MDKQPEYKKVLLLEPPLYMPTHIHPALPYLKAWLEQEAGCEVTQRALSPTAYKYLFKKERLEQRLKQLSHKEQWIYREAAHNAEQAIEDMRDIEVYRDFQRFKQTKQTLEQAAEIVEKTSDARYFGIFKNTFQYVPNHNPYSIDEVIDAVKNKQDNVFFDYFKHEVMPMIKDNEIVGISVSDYKQVIPAMILAEMIKEQNKDVKIVIGGNLISRNRDELVENPKTPDLLKNVDYLIYGEGEMPFSNLVEALKGNLDIDEVKQLIYLKNNIVKHNQGYYSTKDVVFPTPSFEGLLETEWSPEPYVPVIEYRGCYHKCNFCDIPAGYNSFQLQENRKLDIQKFVDDVEELNKQGIKYLSFTDETFYAVHMKRFAKEVINRGLDIEWDCYGRMEKQFEEPEFCRLIYEAGCRNIQFGIETVNLDTLRAMNKGTYEIDQTKILKSSHEAGIMNHIFVMVGYPGEKATESLSNLWFIHENRDYITTIKPTRFRLAKHSPIAKAILNHSEANETATLIAQNFQALDPKGELQPNTEFRYRDGTKTRTAEMCNKLFDYYIENYHRVNTITKHYVYGQRMMVGRDFIEQNAETVSPRDMTNTEKRALREVFNTAVKEGRFPYTFKEYQKSGNIINNMDDLLERLEELINQKTP